MKYCVGDNVDFIYKGNQYFGEIEKKKGIFIKKYIISYKDKKGYYLTWWIPSKSIIGLSKKGGLI